MGKTHYPETDEWSTETVMELRPVQGSSSGVMYVPVALRRELGLSINDTLNVSVHGPSEYVRKATFTGRISSGWHVTVPADFVKKTGVTLGNDYLVTVAFSTTRNTATEARQKADIRS